jgi:hypothetical protein
MLCRTEVLTALTVKSTVTPCRLVEVWENRILEDVHVNQFFIAHFACFLLVTCFAYISTLKMEAVWASETSVNFDQATWHHIPGDSVLETDGLKKFRTFY